MAESLLLVPAAEVGWIALGDAALSCDPLGGDGVLRAVRQGQEASAFLMAALREPSKTVEWASQCASTFLTYLRERYASYCLETRWPFAPFWERRQSGSARQGRYLAEKHSRALL